MHCAHRCADETQAVIPVGAALEGLRPERGIHRRGRRFPRGESLGQQQLREKNHGRRAAGARRGA
eukprot:9044217-Pyramimonas_sp.AAC.1